MSNKYFDIDKEFAEIRDMYAQDSIEQGFNSLLLGVMGTGKTFSLHTAPKPVLVDMFDPGGERTLRKWIETGEVIVRRFYGEDAKDPTNYRDWERSFDRQRKSGFFSHIGTYAIDSVTTWTEALMNQILKERGRPGEIPQLQDYLLQIYTVRDAIKLCTGLPCNFIATGHIDVERDEVTGRMEAVPMVTGKLKTKLPTLFDEIYVAMAKPSPKGTEYSFLTQHDGHYRARSRLAANGALDKYEDPSFKHIMKKTGFSFEDKDLRLASKQEQQ